jgi:hypothetical protein
VREVTGRGERARRSAISSASSSLDDRRSWRGGRNTTMETRTGRLVSKVEPVADADARDGKERAEGKAANEARHRPGPAEACARARVHGVVSLRVT